MILRFFVAGRNAVIVVEIFVKIGPRIAEIKQIFETLSLL